MIKSIQRRIFNTGSSRTFALPLDWKGRDADRVYIIYDKFLVIVPEELANQIDLQRVQSLLNELLTKGSGPIAI